MSKTSITIRQWRIERRSGRHCLVGEVVRHPRLIEDETEKEILWRKLTPVECERLQTVPDNYTNYVSNSQRYQMLGNGWTIEVIKHIFSFIKS